MALLVFFVDGVGVGPAAPDNVLVRRRRDQPHGLFTFAADRLVDDELESLPAGWRGRTLDPTLGVAGLPQSATGQATIFTGINAAVRLGHHQPAFPGRLVRDLVLEHSLLNSLSEAGSRVTFANAYGPAFPGHRSSPDPAATAPRRSSVSTLASWAAGLRFRTFDDLLAGEAVYHDITRWTTGQRGPALQPVTADAAGRHMASLGSRHDLVVHEHFLLDFVGHRRIEVDADPLLLTLDSFIDGATGALDPATDAAIVISDHGNVEDESVRTHTLNPVPFLGWGRAADIVVDRSLGLDLTAVSPAIRRVIAEASCPSA
jgi:hypothetical protein